jgi:hypothetical protein
MNLSVLGACTNSLCSISTGTAIDGLNSFKFEPTSNMVGLYQDSGNTASAMRSRTGLMTAYIDSTKLDQCELRVYQDLKPSVSKVHNSGTSSGQTFFSYLFTTGASTSNLSFELVSPANSTTTISSIAVYTKPQFTTSVMTLVAGLWFLFFAMSAYTHFGKRPQTRGDPNVKLTRMEFIKQVNQNLVDSIKFCGTSLKISMFFLAYATYTSGVSAVVALAGTYLAGQLQLSGTMTGLVLMYTQLVGVPGALIFFGIANKIGLSRALVVAYSFWLVATILAYLTWTDQNTPMANIWIVMTIFGTGGGGGLSLARSTFSGLIPKGREAEFMGLYNFSSKVIAWSGTVLFTAVNESTKSFPKAFVSLSAFFAIGIVFQIISSLAPMPGFLKGVERISLEELNEADTVATGNPGKPSEGAVGGSTRMTRVDDI